MAIRRIRLENPAVELSLERCPLNTLEEALISGKVDLALTYN